MCFTVDQKLLNSSFSYSTTTVQEYSFLNNWSK